MKRSSFLYDFIGNMYCTKIEAMEKSHKIDDRNLQLLAWIFHHKGCVIFFCIALKLFLSIIFGWVSKENLFFGCSSNVNISLIHPFRDAFLKMIEEEVGHEVLNQQTLRKFAQKINFNLRLSEIVRQTSCTSNLVVMTLPVPKKDNVPTALYLSLLDFITRDMPPFFLVRGNQDSVLTFYSWRYKYIGI